MVNKNAGLAEHFSLDKVIRSNILSLKPYRCARDDYERGILLDANENSLGSALSPTEEIGKKRVGSDEILDLLFRIACTPGDSEGIGDQVVVTPPTYGMYSVCAKVNDVGMITVPLNVQDGAFTVDLERLDEQLAQQSSSRPIKLIILCSPGNPTGTTIPLRTIKDILANPKFKGILVVDEAYIDFAGNEKSAIILVKQGWENLIVTHTLSKGFGLAGIRLGIAYGSPDLIQILNNTKAPYTISSPTSYLGYEATKPGRLQQTEAHIGQLNENRGWLQSELVRIPGLGKILGRTEANFILIQVMNFNSPTEVDSQRAKSVYRYMAEDSELGRTPIVVRYRGDELGCRGCLRITVGSRSECEKLVAKIAQTLELIH